VQEHNRQFVLERKRQRPHDADGVRRDTNNAGVKKNTCTNKATNGNAYPNTTNPRVTSQKLVTLNGRMRICMRDMRLQPSHGTWRSWHCQALSAGTRRRSGRALCNSSRVEVCVIQLS
jgi:hypothetical protein